MPSPDFLPHGAKGIDIGDLTLMEGREKLVICLRDSGFHYTLAFGNRSGILDLHRTWAMDGKEYHEPLFQIAHTELNNLFRQLAPTLRAAIEKLVREAIRLRPGWMRRYGIVALPVTVSPEKLESMTRVRKRRLVIDPACLQDQMKPLPAPEELQGLKLGEAFLLYRIRRRRKPRMIGAGFRLEIAGEQRLVWIPSHKLLRQLRTLSKLFVEEAHAHRWKGEWDEDLGPIKPADSV